VVRAAALEEELRPLVLDVLDQVSAERAASVAGLIAEADASHG